MENALENLAGNNEDLTHEQTRKGFVRMFDRFVDSNLGIGALVLGTIPVYFVGSDILEPVVNLILSNGAEAFARNGQSLNTSDIHFTNFLAGISAVSIYGIAMGNVVQNCSNRIQGIVPEKFRNYNSKFFRKAFYVDEIKSGMKKAAGYFSRNKAA